MNDYDDYSVLSLDRKVDPDDEVEVSKTLSWLLRHGGAKAGLKIRSDGYADLEDLLYHKQVYRFGTTLGDLYHIEANNAKKRF